MKRLFEMINQGENEGFLHHKLVSFMVCGTQKGGTSALDTYLRGHSEICMATVKEPHFFDDETHFLGDYVDYSQYHKFFAPQKNHRILGESTPIYMYWQNSPERIRNYNPAMKLIVLLRNPIERAYSHWNMERLRNADNLPFWEAITNERERCAQKFPLQHRVYSYIDRGYYTKQLQRIWSYFQKDRVLVIKSEELKHNTYQTLNKICSFLEVDSFKTVLPKEVNSRLYESEMSKKERDYLRSVYYSEIKELETELNWDCTAWLK